MTAKRTALPQMARYLDLMRSAPGGADLATSERGLLDVVAGARVLDLGCGTGEDARAFAAVAGDLGSVIGLDSDAAMLRLARERSTNAKSVTFVQGDAHALPFDDGSFDHCFSSRLLHLVADPRRVVAEMARVTARGGVVVISMEPDWDTLVVDVPSRDLARRVLAARSDCFSNPWSGRSLRRLAVAAGLTDVRVRASTVMITAMDGDDQPLPIPWGEQAATMNERGLISTSEMDQWLHELHSADAAGAFFAAVTFFTLSARRD